MMSYHRSETEKVKILEELRQSGFSIRKFSQRNGLSNSTVRKWRDKYWYNQGGFVKLEKSERPTSLLKAENVEFTEKKNEGDAEFGNEQNVLAGQDLVAIGNKGVKVTASLEQTLKILEKSHDRIQ